MFKDLKHLLLISDLDGTLLPSDKRIPPEDLEIIRQFQAAGGRFTIATGRTYEAASVYLEQVQPNAPVILYNGAMLFDPVKKQPIATLPLASSVRQIVRELLNWNPDMGAEILTADGIYVIRLNAVERQHIATCGVSPVFTDLAHAPEDGWLKVLFALEPPEVDRLAAYAASRQDTEVEYVRSADVFLEILPAGVSKGTAIARFRDRLADRDTQIAAAGDYDNDLTMLQHADVGIAPANAQPNVKAAADLVLPDTCDQHGLPRLMQQLMERT